MPGGHASTWSFSLGLRGWLMYMCALRVSVSLQAVSPRGPLADSIWVLGRLEHIPLQKETEGMKMGLCCSEHSGPESGAGS